MKKEIEEFLDHASKAEPSRQIVDALILLVREMHQEINMLKQEAQQRELVFKQEIQLLKDEIAILKNQKPRPKIEPSTLEKDAKPKDGSNKKNNWSKNSKNDKLKIDSIITIEVPRTEISEDAVFKGYAEYTIQELVIRRENRLYRLAQYQGSDGKYITAKLPEEIEGHHFGPGLRQHIIYQYHANRVPQNRIIKELLDKGIIISSGQIDAILVGQAEEFKEEKEDILPAGLEAENIEVDDTGARHKKKNGFATVIRNKFFTYFKSSFSKSRINFLEILCGSPSNDKIEYIITSETIDYVKAYTEKTATLNLLQQSLGVPFVGREAWAAFLKKHLFGKSVTRAITEGTLIGTLIARKILTLEQIIMSDGAGQFSLFRHVLCWIHIERALKRLIPLNDQDRKEINQVLNDFWIYYRELKDYKLCTTEEQQMRKPTLLDRFDAIFSFQATEIPLAQALKKIRDSKQELLLVLDCPNLPLHNNGSEGDIREFVTKRKISGGTRSDAGREARDTFTSLYKTCVKLKISFWEYLKDRINGTKKIRPLAEIIREKIAQHKVGFAAAGP